MPPFEMTRIYDILLRGTPQTPVGVYHLQLTTAEQLCRLHYSQGSIKTIKARLKTLVDHGYLQADAVPTKQYRSPYYYTLGSKGVEYLESLGCDIPPDWRANKATNKGHLFIDHTLDVNDILIAAALLPRQHPQHRLETFIHERITRRTPFKVKVGNRPYSLIPDAFLDFRFTSSDGTQRRKPVLLEHDRGTEGQNHFKERVRAYITWVKNEGYRPIFGTKNMTVAFTTFEGGSRLEKMRLWTRQELAATNESKALGITFFFATLPKPPTPEEAWLSEGWRTPYDEDNPPPLLAI